MDSPQITELIARLSDGDKGVRISAVKTLASMGEPAVPALLTALNDVEISVCRNAVIALGVIGNPTAISALIEVFTERDAYIRRAVTRAFREIGDAAAVPALIAGLNDQDNDVRCIAAESLGEMRDASAVLALVATLNDKERNVRGIAAKALSRMGARAILVLIEALKDKNGDVRQDAARALGRLGDSATLPRIIVADSSSSAQLRIDTLEKLRVASNDHERLTLRYTFPDTRTLCETVLNEDNVEARKGAHTILNWLNGDRDLLMASQRDFGIEPRELLRASRGGAVETHPETLLIAANEPEPNRDPHPTSPTIWHRLFGHKKDTAS